MNKEIKTLRFSHSYDKLSSFNPVFTTIRRRKQCNLWDHVKILSPLESLYGQCIGVIEVCFKDLPAELLLVDTSPHAKTPEQARILIQSFYKKMILADEKIYLHFILKY